MKKIFFAFFAIVIIMASGCKGFLDENPKSSFIGVEAYSNPKLIYINCVASLYVPSTIPNLTDYDQLLYYFDNAAADLVITPEDGTAGSMAVLTSRFSSTISTRLSENWLRHGTRCTPISRFATDLSIR